MGDATPRWNIVDTSTPVEDTTPSVPEYETGEREAARWNVPAGTTLTADSVWTGPQGEQGPQGEPGLSDGMVSVESYGTTGGGVTDDTAAIQAAFAASSGSTVYFPQGIYLVSDTITIGDDYTTVCGGGAVILLSDSPDTDGFDETCRVFDVQDKTGVTISGLTFREPASATSYSALAYGAGIIRLHDSVGCEVSGCRFEFDGFATGQTNYLNSVWVEGTSADDNRILDNYCLGAAIEYAYNGPSRTTVRGNSVVNSPYNGISGHCGSNAGTDNIVDGNIIIAPARMGIEDWGDYMTGTTIRGNVIHDTGYSLSSGFGISVVSIGALVEGNRIVDFEDYGIEAVGNRQTISGNHLLQESAGHTATGTGIMVNTSDTGCSTVVSGNTLIACDVAIHAYEWGSLVVSGNGIVDPGTKGIYGQPNSSDAQAIAINGNVIEVTAQNADERQLMTLLANAGAGSARYAVTGNTLVYDAAADGGADYELAIVVSADEASFTGNHIDGGGIDYSGTTPIVTANGTTPENVTVIGNHFTGGATLVTTGMVTPVVFSNPGLTPSEVTGDRSDGVALTNLLTALDTLGLITDSTTA